MSTDTARMSGYRAHAPDLIEDPHHWLALFGNPDEVLCGVCGEMQTQNDEPPVWTTVREGVQQDTCVHGQTDGHFYDDPDEQEQRPWCIGPALEDSE